VGAVRRVGAGAIAIAAAVVAAVLLLGRDAQAPAARPGAPLTVRATITPPISGFGDRLVARVAVLVDPRAVDAQRVRVTENLAPLTPLGPLHAQRSANAVVIAIPVSCLASACTSDGGARAVSLSAVRVEAPGRKGGIVSVEARWPTLEVRGRVLSSEVDVRRAPRFRANLSLPAVRYRSSPATLAALLDALAVLLALAAVTLAAWQFVVWTRRPRDLQPNELAHALALARASRLRPVPDRRRALGLVARVLGDREEPLSSPASELAWSKRHPSQDELGDLVDRVTREVER
jgi:hypothetical protein